MHKSKLIRHAAPIAAALCLTTLCAAQAPAPAGAEPGEADIAKAAGVEAGLCVHLGTTDGKLEASLARSGRLLVHGLALDASSEKAARDRLRADALYGVASIEQAPALATLPYADNLVNLLLADLDALKDQAPPQKEMLRVLSPGGVAYTRKGGAWTRTPKPRSKGLDDWQQYFYNAAMNPVSADTHVAPSTSLQWISGYFERGASHSANSGVIISGNRTVYVYKDNKAAPGKGAVITCRDSFSGARIWSYPVASEMVKQTLLAVGGEVYCVPEANGPLVALDIQTGTLIRKYDQGARAYMGHNSANITLPTIYHDGMLLQTVGDTAYLLDAATGALKWKYSDAGKNLYLPIIGGGKAYFATGPEKYSVWRQPASKTDAVVAVDLATGKETWRNQDLAGETLGQLCYDNATLAALSWSGIGSGGKTNNVISLDAATGKTRWTADYNKATSFNAGVSAMIMFRGGELQVGTLVGFVAYDPLTGAQKRVVTNKVPGVSSYQCNATRATENFLLSYSTVFTANDGLAVRRFLSRSTCGTGVFPANGMLYTTANYCGCHTMLRGYMALASQDPGAPADDARRLVQTQDTKPAFAKPDAWPRADEWPTFMGNTQRHASTTGEVAADLTQLWQVRVAATENLPKTSLVTDWFENDQNPGRATPPIVAGGTVFVAAPESHTLHAFDAATGKPTWTFTANARVGIPTVYGGLCLFGGHDGWVYALRADNGQPAWRFQAAFNDRKIVAYGQLESAWPVASTVTIHDGAAFVAAGRHPQADGGIRLYRLDPATGQVQWKATYTGDPAPISSAGNRVINDVLTSDGTLLYLKGLAIHPATGKTGEPARGKGAKPGTIAFEDGTTAPAGRYASSRWGLVTSYTMSWGGSLGASHWAIGPTAAYAHKAGMWNSPLQTKYLSAWRPDVFQHSPDGRKSAKEQSLWLNDATRDDNRGKATVTALIAAGNRVIVGGRDGEKGYVEIFDAADGAKVASFDLPEPPVEKGLAVAHGKIYVSGVNGTVTCLGGK